MKTKSITLSILVAGLILVGCSSSSTNDDTTAQNTTSLISGTVPGTLIEAFCNDGSYYRVNSTTNDTNEHPFEIEIPTALNCRLVMTTNEDDPALKVITPIGFITPDGNGTLFSASDELIDLGYIDLAMSRDDINDTNGDGVSDDILELLISSGELLYVELEDDPTDSDGDGLLNVYEDDDNDGIHNHDDEDDDNDGIDDVDENDNDFDNDGINNDEDVDNDNDSVHNDEDSDDDNDGIEDSDDSDDDNDGIDDYLENDSDEDELEESDDENSDNDNN